MRILTKLKASKLPIIFLGVFTIFSFISPAAVSFQQIHAKTISEMEQELAELQRLLQEIEGQKSNLQSQLDQNGSIINGYTSEVSTLYNETAILSQDIDKLNIEIQQLEVQIEILTTEIATKKEEISSTEKTITNLTEESEKRIQDGYYNYRVYNTEGDPGVTLFNLGNINDYFKSSQYKELIQSDTNNLMVKVAELKQQLQEKKKELDTKILALNKDKEVLDVKKTDITKKKDDLDVKIANYLVIIGQARAQNSITQSQIDQVSATQAQKQAEAYLLQQELFSNYVPPGGGQYVLAGTYIGKQGCTGYCFGAHVHFMVGYGQGGYYSFNQDPCGYLKPGVVEGCGGGSLEWPLKHPNISQWYSGGHQALDIWESPWNSPVFAAHNGYVYKEYDCYHYDIGLAGSCANVVILCEDSGCTGLKTGYWHLSEF